MEYEAVAGERVPKIGLGTWRMAGATCRRAVRILGRVSAIRIPPTGLVAPRGTAISS